MYILKNQYLKKLFTYFIVTITQFPQMLKVFNKLKKITDFLFGLLRIRYDVTGVWRQNILNIVTLTARTEIWKNPDLKKLFPYFILMITQFPQSLKVFNKLKKITDILFCSLRIRYDVTGVWLWRQNVLNIVTLTARLKILKNPDLKKLFTYFIVTITVSSIA